jgi:dihydrodipicolinate synthase/N-acetylneuraminate lyase
MNRETIRNKIVGNVVPLPGQFNKDLSINFSGYKEHIKFLLSNNVKVFYLALAASEFEHMTYKERLEVTEICAQTIGSKGILLAQATNSNWLTEQIEEANALYKSGADAIVIKPTRMKETSSFFNSKFTQGDYNPLLHDDFFVNYIYEFANIANVPIVFHDALFKNGLGISIECLERIAKIDQVVCFKFHMLDPCARQNVYSKFGNQIATFDGLHKPLQIWSLIWGASARHTNWSWFDPIHDQKFYEFVKNKDYKAAIDLVEIEWPLANAIRQTGYRGFKEVMHIMGLPGRYCRIPGKELNANQILMIKDSLKKSGYI